MKKKSSFRRIFNIISTALLILAVALVVIIFIMRITGHVPSIFGYTVYRVQTDSMEPTLMVGDIIVDKKVAPDEIKNGDIITYYSSSGALAGHTITHRVVKEPEVKNGTYYYQTQGDKQGAEPDQAITYDQVEGKYIKTLPWINKIYSFFLSPYGLITFIFVILVLFGYEIISLVVSYRALDEKDDDYFEPKPKKSKKKRR